MREEKNTSELIKVDAEKCVNCHYCIGVCPVKYCNDASEPGKGIRVNASLCIGCGACIKACSHEARYFSDDTATFFNDLENREKISILVAPAVEANFPDQLKKLLGWMKEKGVEMSFDVSLGAEITTFQYFKAIKSGAKTPIISQPCPCIVSYIEIYKPDLIPYLAPTGSPAMDMASWVHHYYPGMKLAFIGPCIAKKREFEDPDTKGKIAYNITISELKKYLREKGVDLDDSQDAEFDSPMEPETALLYSQPGGLFEAFKRYDMPLRINQVRVTEGVKVYEEVFNELETEIKNNNCDVVLIDVLNCSNGCNRGTGTIYNERTTNEILKFKAGRLEENKEHFYNRKENIKKLENFLESMDDIDFSRKYTDKSYLFTALEDPTPEITEIINEQMGKFEKKDIKNCGACGYASCSGMSKAVLNNLYRPEQCHHFLESFYKAHSGDQH